MSQDLHTAAKQLADILSDAQRIVVLQADNPDADSLGSALALEELLGNMGKDVELYCSVDTPTYLRYIEGWDRIDRELPKHFDASIIVDASTRTLFEKLQDSGQFGWLATKPCIVIDHHAAVQDPIDFAGLSIVEPSYASAGDIIFHIAKTLDWPLNQRTAECLATSILGDTQGLTNSLATSETYRTISELIDSGVNRPELEEQRRAASKMAEQIYRYKSTLIARTEFYHDNRLALVVIPQAEIHQYSPLYNPAPLIQGDMLQVENVGIALVFKRYDDGHITASIRCNPTAGIADLLATHFGGGGHAFASGFKISNGKSIDEVKTECIQKVGELLGTL